MNVLSKSVVWTLAAFILVALCVQDVSAQRRKPRDYQLFEMSFRWRGDQQLSVSGFPSEVRDVRAGSVSDPLPDRALKLVLTDGFDCIITYRPYRIFSVGFAFTSFKQATEPGQRYVEELQNNSVARWYGVSGSESRFGLVAYVTTPWSNPRRESPWLLYRAKMGARFDATGTKLEAANGYGDTETFSGIHLGRIREHQFFMGLELGVRDPKADVPGVFFIQLMYIRSMYVLDPAGNASGLKASSNSTGTVRFAVGISI